MRSKLRLLALLPLALYACDANLQTAVDDDALACRLPVGATHYSAPCVDSLCWARDIAPTHTRSHVEVIGNPKQPAVGDDLRLIAAMAAADDPEQTLLNPNAVWRVISRGEGCIDCPPRETGHVQFNYLRDADGVAHGVAMDFECVALERPGGPPAPDAGLNQRCGHLGVEAQIDDGELRVVWPEAVLARKATAAQCLAEWCAAINTFDADRDHDGVGDVCDNCVASANRDQHDAHGDGVGDVCQPHLDADGDGRAADADCDDANPTRHPGARELCSGVDEDCDGAVDEFIGEACVGGLGVCAADGVWRCDPIHGRICEAPVGAPVAEACARAPGVDDDCDGVVDEDMDVPCLAAVGTLASNEIATIADTAAELVDTRMHAVDARCVDAEPDWTCTEDETIGCFADADCAGIGQCAVEHPRRACAAQPHRACETDADCRLDLARAGIVTGTVRWARCGSDDRACAAAAVTIGVLEHPEFGVTHTDSAGRFALPVEGDGRLTLRFRHARAPEVQRRVRVRPHEMVVAPDVLLTPFGDSHVLERVPHLAQSVHLDAVRDADGYRRPQIFLPRGVRVRGDGAPIDGPLRIRATEYTVGATGPLAMPAPMPDAADYTYAAEFSIDGYEHIEFTDGDGDPQPVFIWIENFIGLPVGAAVPAAAYDRDSAQWMPSTDGVVLEVTHDPVLGVQVEDHGVLIDMHTDADGIAAGLPFAHPDGPAFRPDNCPFVFNPAQTDADENGIGDACDVDTACFETVCNHGRCEDGVCVVTDVSVVVGADERAMLADRVQPGQTARFWRVPVTHFTPWDFNIGGDCANCEAPEGDPLAQNGPMRNPNCAGGSIIECENQVLGERFAVIGTGLTLNYRSNRAPGYLAGRHTSINAAGRAANRIGTDVDFSVAGQRHTVNVDGRTRFVAGDRCETCAQRDDTVEFTWDGRDGLGRPVLGQRSVTGQVTHNYLPQAFVVAASAAGSFGALPSPWLIPYFNFVGRGLFGRSRSLTTTLTNFAIPGAGLGGWTFDVHHRYDPASKTLVRGDGTWRQIEAAQRGSTITTLIGNGQRPDRFDFEANGETGPRSTAVRPKHLAVGTDGELWIADEEGARTYTYTQDGALRLHTHSVNASRDVDEPKVVVPHGVPGAFVVYARDHGPRNGRLNSDWQSIWNQALARTWMRVFWFSIRGHNQPAMAGCGEILDAVELDEGHAFIAAGCPDVFKVFQRQVPCDGDVCVIRFEPAVVRLTQPGELRAPRGLTLAPGDGERPSNTLYVADVEADRIAAVDLRTGAVTTAADTLPECPDGVDCPPLVDPIDVAWHDGTLYILQAGGLLEGERVAPYVRALDGRGRVRVIAGNGHAGHGPDDVLALDSSIYPGLGDLDFVGSAGFAVLEDGSIVFGEARYNRIRRISRDTHAPQFEWRRDEERHVVPEPSGAVAHTFDARARHLRTVEVATGRTLYAFEYAEDAPDQLRRIVDPLGQVVHIDPRADGWQVRGPNAAPTRLRVHDGWLTRWEGPPGEVGEAPVVREFHYDDGGLLTAMVAPGPGQPEGRTWHFEYDALGRLTSDADPIAHAAGAAITLERVEHPDGVQEIIHRSAEGRETGFLTMTGGGGRTLMTRTRRDADGERVEVVTHVSGRTITDLESGATVEDVYGAHPRWGLELPQLRSRVLEVPIDETVYRRRVDFDHHIEDGAEIFETTVDDRVWSTRVAHGADGYHVEFTTPEGRQSAADFDASGRLIAARAGMLPELAYDWSARYPDRIDAAHSIVAGDARTTTVEHLNRRAARLINAAGEQVDLFLDGRLRLERVRLPDDAEIDLEHDERDQLMSLTPPGRAAHRFDGDIRGAQTLSLPPAFSVDAPDTPTAYAHNLDGQPTCVEMPDERVIWHAYDDAGLLESVHLFERAVAGQACPPPGEPDIVIDHAYDADQQLMSATRDDGAHQVRIEAHPDGLRPDATLLLVDGVEIGDTRVDIAEDMRVQALEIEGERLPIIRDADGLVLQVGAMRLHRTHPDAPGHDGGLGSVEGATFEWAGARLDTEYTFNARGEVAAKQVSLDGTVIYQQHFDARDAVSRLLEVREAIGDDEIASTYTYDVRGRLVEALRDNRLTTYAYDANNNLTRRTIDGEEALGQVDGQDRLIDFDGTEFDYNATGQLEAIRRPSGDATHLTYDVSGNLLRADVGEHSIEYLVDPADRRVGRRVDGGEWQHLLWLGDHLVAELNAQGEMTRRFVYGTRSTTPDAMLVIDPQTGTTRPYAIVHDHLGSVRLVVDMQTQAIAQRIDYDAFGRVLHDSNPGFQPFGFTGGLYDPITGLVRLDARDYDPETQRWTAKDPIGFAGGDANLYAYVGNDPVNFTDPSGLAWEEDVSSFFAGIGDAVTFGLTKKMRNGLGVGDLVDECSGAYKAGEIAADVGSLGAGAMRGLGRRFSRRLGRRRPLSRGCRFGRNSFVEGTLVLTADGEQPIETIEPGDLVLTLGESGPELQPVIDRFDGESDALWTATVRFDDGAQSTLVGTAEHPIYVPSAGRWIELAELQVGDDLQGFGQPAWVEAVERTESAARVFNLAVEGTHSFYAGGVLVHNSTQPPCGRAAQGKKPRNRPPGPDPAANGRPHSIIERAGPDGQYTTHYGDGTYKQYRGSGKDHGGIPRPNVKENTLNVTPDGRTFPGKPTVRPARPDEVPGD